MAEGGDSNESNNPYSFGSFIKTGKHNGNVNGVVVEEDAEPDIGIARIRENDRNHEELERSANRREENPFSFRQFLKKDVSGSKNKSDRSYGRNHHHHYFDDDVIPARTYQKNTVPELKSDLPDFVQGHFKIDGAHIEANEGDTDVVLPDFTLDNLNRGSHHTRTSKNVNTHKKSLLSNARDPTHQIECNSRGNGQSEASVGSSLPDFLSDGPMLNNVCDRHKPESLSSSIKLSNHGYSVSETRSKNNCEDVADNTLKHENQRLQRELEHTQELLSRERFRVTECNHEIEILRKKDKDEAVALELMVQQVETNMQGTEERATSAEATIAKLKQEVKCLQLQLANISKENEILRTSNLPKPIMTERVKLAADQMRSAADSAHFQLTQLMTGVESLKLLATFLADFDKSTTGDVSNNER